MEREWNDSQPIYRQLRDRVVALILDGVLSEGDPLPSVLWFAPIYVWLLLISAWARRTSSPAMNPS